MGRRDVGGGQAADDRVGIGRQSIAPLLPMLVIAPIGLVGRDVGFGDELQVLWARTPH